MSRSIKAAAAAAFVLAGTFAASAPAEAGIGYYYSAPSYYAAPSVYYAPTYGYGYGGYPSYSGYPLYGPGYGYYPAYGHYPAYGYGGYGFSSFRYRSGFRPSIYSGGFGINRGWGSGYSRGFGLSFSRGW